MIRQSSKSLRGYSGQRLFLFLRIYRPSIRYHFPASIFLLFPDGDVLSGLCDLVPAGVFSFELPGSQAVPEVAGCCYIDFHRLPRELVSWVKGLLQLFTHLGFGEREWAASDKIGRIVSEVREPSFQAALGPGFLKRGFGLRNRPPFLFLRFLAGSIGEY